MTEGRAVQTVLVVDDQAALRETLADFLTGEGYRVEEAASVAEARLQISKHKPDLILLDLNMPGGDGLSYAAEVRSASAIPIIILSGKGGLVDRVVGLEVGADDYLAKPFELRELLARIRAVMRRTMPPPSPAVAPGADQAVSAPVERLARFGGGLVFNPGRRQVHTEAGTSTSFFQASSSVRTALCPETPYPISFRVGNYRFSIGASTRSSVVCAKSSNPTSRHPSLSRLCAERATCWRRTSSGLAVPRNPAPDVRSFGLVEGRSDGSCKGETRNRL